MRNGCAGNIPFRVGTCRWRTSDAISGINISLTSFVWSIDILLLMFLLHKRKTREIVCWLDKQNVHNEGTQDLIFVLEIMCFNIQISLFDANLEYSVSRLRPFLAVSVGCLVLCTHYVCEGTRGSVVIATNRKVAGSIPDEVIFKFT
jgi:hypothetical protein